MEAGIVREKKKKKGGGELGGVGGGLVKSKINLFNFTPHLTYLPSHSNQFYNHEKHMLIHGLVQKLSTFKVGKILFLPRTTDPIFSDPM